MRCKAGGATFMGLDWANKVATILVYTRCSYISWFMIEPMEHSE